MSSTLFTDNSTSSNNGVMPGPDVMRITLLVSVLSVATLLLGGALTGLGLGAWYDALQVPPWQPPSWAFTPAWVMIFSLLTMGTVRIFRLRDDQGKIDKFAKWLFAIQLVLNAGWSLCFFALKSPQLALIEIFILNVLVIAMLIRYLQLDKLAGLLQLPYVLWLFFATAINFWIVQNN